MRDEQRRHADRLYLETDQPAAFDQDVEPGDHAGEVVPGLSAVWRRYRVLTEHHNLFLQAEQEQEGSM